MLDAHRAKLDLRNKTKFERRMMKNLTPILTKIVKNAKKQLLTDQKKFDVSLWEKEFVILLREHYRNVSTLFSRNLENQIGLKIRLEKRVYLEEQLEQYFNKEVEMIATQLTDESVKNANFAYNVAKEQQQQQIESGEDVSHKEFLAIFANVFRKRLNKRKKTISVTETQKAAEVSKFVEYEVLETGKTIINKPGLTTRLKGFKDWYAVLDDVTRKTHVIADRTQRNIPVDRPYKVGRSHMMFPGDRSLNAPLKEIINCRCISIYKNP